MKYHAVHRTNRQNSDTIVYYMKPPRRTWFQCNLNRKHIFQGIQYHEGMICPRPKCNGRLIFYDYNHPMFDTRNSYKEKSNVKKYVLMKKENLKIKALHSVITTVDYDIRNVDDDRNGNL